MDNLIHDVRYALRMLRKSPGFTGVAVLTLALGIGANSAIFTVVNALLLRMLPVRDPQQLVVVGNPAFVSSRSTGTPRTDVFSYPLYKELRDHNSVFTGLCAAGTDHNVDVSVGPSAAGSEKVTGRLISGNYFTLLGVQSAAGRLISDSDDTAEDANPVVVLGYRFWQTRFSLDPSIVGKSIRLNGYPFTVVGVAPASFEGDVVGERMAVFVPLSMQSRIIRGRQWLAAPHTSWLSLIGRLKPHVTRTQAEVNMNLVFRQALASGYGATLTSDDINAIRDSHIEVAEGSGGLSGLRATYRTPLLMLMGIVALVLLLACVNVANLLLARASIRKREIAVRLAVGARPQRILRQLLTESILLASLGGIAGSLLAVLGVRILLKLFVRDAVLDLSLDLRVLAFTVGISLVTGILFGLVPALRTLKIRVSPGLQDRSQAVPTASRFGLGKALIGGQVAVSLLVLFAASLLVRSLQKVLTQDFGYSRDRLVIARLDPVSSGYDNEKMKVLAEQLVSRIAPTPGISAVTYSTNGLFANTESADAILVSGFKPSGPQDRGAREDYVGPDYFKVVGIPILAGRGIEAQDSPTSTRVAVVNEAMVKHFFAEQDPIGRQFRVDDPEWLDKPITIVGVSRNAKDHGSGLRDDVQPRFYLAYQQMPEPIQVVIEARTRGSAASGVADIRNQILATDPHLKISFVETLDNLVEGSAAELITLTRLSSFFGALALLLACVGLYGVMSYTVAARTREIGVRMAMGARRSDMARLVLREGLLLVAGGIAIGIPVALASGRLLQSFLFELKSTDPISLSVVVITLALVALVAGYLPARRAAKVDPMVALRYE